MKTKTGLLILLLGAALLGAGYFCGTSLGGRKAPSASIRPQGATTEELAWMRKDFALSDAEFARVCALHEAYRPHCDAMCAEINAATMRLSRAIEEHVKISPEVEAALRDYEASRARCQRDTLDHLTATAAAMNPAAGRAFLHAVLPHLLNGGQHISHLQHPADHP